jgi:hypothetical protein
MAAVIVTVLYYTALGLGALVCTTLAVACVIVAAGYVWMWWFYRGDGS